MINLTAARLIWLLYTSDRVEEGAGSGLDLMRWVGSSWVDALLPALFWLLPCCPLLPHVPSSEAYRFPPTLTPAASLLALTPVCLTLSRDGFCSQETPSLPLPLPIAPPTFLLNTFWKENNQGAAKSREGWAAACTPSLNLNDGSSSRLGCSPRPCLQGTRATVFLMGQTPP